MTKFKVPDDAVYEEERHFDPTSDQQVEAKIVADFILEANALGLKGVKLSSAWVRLSMLGAVGDHVTYVLSCKLRGKSMKTINLVLVQILLAVLCSSLTAWLCMDWYLYHVLDPKIDKAIQEVKGEPATKLPRLEPEEIQNPRAQ